MSASTLTLSSHDLNAHIGRFLGYGSTPSDWAVEGRQQDIDQCRRMGYRRFLYPSPTARDKVAYTWSFLSPVYTQALLEDVEDYTLPTDFGGLNGFITHDMLYRFTPMEVVGEWAIRHLRKTEGRGMPNKAAIVPLPSNVWRLMVYPKPDTNYNVSLRYNRIPNDLTALSPLPLGGVQHGQTILYACLAEAERLRDDEYGNHNEAFQERLAASSEIDKKARTPNKIGYNGDPSDDTGRGVNVDHITITYDGTIVG
jgi:hypothetical protein